MIRFDGTIAEADVPVVASTIRELVSVRDVDDARFVSLPMLYPDGSNVTVRLTRAETGGICVSDSGFAYHEAESIGAERSFSHLVKGIAEPFGVSSTTRSVFVNTNSENLYRSICDVAAVSWRVAAEIFTRYEKNEPDEIEFADEIRERVRRIFGSRFRDNNVIVGASTSEWEMSAVVDGAEGQIVFQGVQNYAYSIYKASTAFNDIANAERHPKLIAVVSSKKALGSKLALLSRDGRVIETSQSDAAFLRAAA